MTEPQIPPSALGHLCDDFSVFPEAEWQEAIQKTLKFIQEALPDRLVSHNSG